MTKEEKIAEAYGDKYDKYKPDSDGWSTKTVFEWDEVIKNDFITKSIAHGMYKVRPKSLQGIENNNGYTKIESEKDIPTEEGVFWVLRRGFHKPMYRVINDLFDEEEKSYWLENYTHFIKVNRPENLPIY